MTTRNIFIKSEDELTLVYASDELTDQEVKDFFVKVTNKEIQDYFEARNDELQYYIIDGRAYMHTPQAVARVREILQQG